MQTYIVLLRGINVSGQKKIHMAELRKALGESGFRDVSTYIQSGNIILRHYDERDVVGARIHTCLLNVFGMDVPVLTFEPEDWEAIYSDNPYAFKEGELKNFYFVFLFDTPPAEQINKLAQESFPKEEFHIAPKCIYLNCHQGYGKAKCTNNFFEQRLQVRATTRNHRTVQKLMQMAAEMD